MPRITVLCSTFRIGGIDVLYQTLISQTFRDFEFILVDRHWEHRHNEVAGFFDVGFPFLHIPPRKILPYLDTGLATNTGLALARGELVCFLGDYTYAPPSWLENHWRVYQDFGGSATLSGYRDRIEPPPLNEILDIEHCKISCFQQTFDPRQLDRLGVLYQERKPAAPVHYIRDTYYSIPWHSFFIYGNESLPKAIIDKIGGVDERYDGGAGWQDSDMGYRAFRAGHSFIYDSKAVVVKKIEVRSFLPGYTIIPNKSNEAIFRQRLAKDGMRL